MLDKLIRGGGATIVGVGLVVAVTKPTIAPMSYAADLRLTTTVLAMGGLGYQTLEPELLAQVLGGAYANDHLVGLPWPGELAPFIGTLTLNQSVAVGLETMDEAIRNQYRADPNEDIIVAGASGSTLVVDEEMRRLANDPTAPPANKLSFGVLGDANRGVFKQLRGLTLPIFDYTVPEIPVTKYNILVVTGEYDGLGDWPDRSWNLLADLNALAGTSLLQLLLPKEIVDQFKLDAFGSVHYDAMFADLTKVPAKNITTTTNVLGGVTTTYLVPTADLPLLRPLKALGVPQDVIDTLEKVLRPIIDSAYVRNDQTRPRPDRTAAAALAPSTSAEGTTTALPAARPVRATASLRPSTTSAAAKPTTLARPTAANSAGGKADRRSASSRGSAS
jgi:hypothetical protein